VNEHLLNTHSCVNIKQFPRAFLNISNPLKDGGSGRPAYIAKDE
jgi:hypothetical protein